MKGQMKRILGLKGWATLLAGALVLGSCVEDEVLENQDDLTPKKSISFDAVVDWPEDYIEGRGAVLTDEDDLASFHVWATLNRQASLGAPIAYFSDIAFTKQDSENRYASSASQTYYWPGEGPTLDFVAVGNKPASNFVATMNDNDNRVASFTYTVPTAAAKQNDVVVAVTDTENPIAGNYNEAVPLTFNHIMSAINVSVGTTMTAGTINSITFSGIKNTGTYNVATPAWTFAQNPTTDTYPVTFAEDGVANNKGYSVTGKASGTKINDADATLMLLPQSFTTDNSKIIVNFTYAATGNTVNLEASLNNQTWQIGKAYNYYLNIEPDFTVSIDVKVQPWDLETTKNEFMSTAMVIEEEWITWGEGTKIEVDDNGYSNIILGAQKDASATLRFRIAHPVGGTWKAFFVTKDGVPDSFELNVAEGAVGDWAEVTISTKEANSSKTKSNVAELRFIVQMGQQRLSIENLTENGKNYRIVQNPTY